MAPVPETPHPFPSGRCQDGTHRAHEFVTKTFGGDINAGCYNPRSTLPSGRPSFHVAGCAFDVGLNWYDSVRRGIGNLIWDWCMIHADALNMQEMIWGDRIVTARRWNEGVRTYGLSDHKNHLHCAMGWVPAHNFVPGAVPAGAPTAAEIAEYFRKLEEKDVEHGMAVDLVVNPTDASKGYTLDRWGGVHPFGGAPEAKGGPWWQGQDVARRLVITNWKRPAGYVLDLFGGVHPFGGAASVTGAAYWKGGKILPFNEV